MKPYKVLTINPGSTSTKVALFQGRNACIPRLSPMRPKSWNSMHPCQSSCPTAGTRF